MKVGEQWDECQPDSHESQYGAGPPSIETTHTEFPHTGFGFTDIVRIRARRGAYTASVRLSASATIVATPRSTNIASRFDCKLENSGSAWRSLQGSQMS